MNSRSETMESETESGWAKVPHMSPERPMILLWLTCAGLLFALMFFLHRDVIRSPSDYALLGGYCCAFTIWAVAAARVRDRIQGWALPLRGILLAALMLCIAFGGALVRRNTDWELSKALFSGSALFPFLLPILPAVFGSSETED
jgi:hypothetical protein